MSETKWPKGPWHYQEQSDAYTHIVRGPNHEYIGSAPQGTDGGAEATAKLWAAAPDMYSMLASVVERFDELKSRDATQHEFACCVYSINAVLAKARGES